MREFTKSMMSYTWAMSLFGVQQMANAFSPSKATESFDNVTKATRDEFSEALRATFRAGDNLQRGLVDITFSVFTFGMFDRRSASATASDVGRQSAEAFRQGMRAAGQTVDAVGQAVQGATYAADNAARQSVGWAAAPDAGRADDSHAAPSTQQPGTQGGQAQGWGPMPSQSSDPPRR
jgi:hypothetical protein